MLLGQTMETKRLNAFSVCFSCLQTFLIIVSLHEVAAKKLLLVPPQVGSHVFQANSIADGLIAKGHEVHIIIDAKLKLPPTALHPDVKVIRFDSGVDVIVYYTPAYQAPLLAMELEDMTIMRKLQVVSGLFEILNVECRRLFENKDLFQALLREKYDFVVTDGFMPCLAIIPNNLGVPFASFVAFFQLQTPDAALQAPLLVRGPFDGLLTSENTPTVVSTLAKVILAIMMRDSGQFNKYSNNTPLFDISKKCQLWLYDKSLVLDHPVPVSPNVIYVGGLNVRQPKPIKDKVMKQFADSAPNGFILVSFGSFAEHFPDWLVTLLLESFAEISERIIWKWDRRTLKPEHVVPKNVLLANWIPQNDVLGHPNIKLFITHCGNSGQHEALYNGVPMLAIPLFGDQIVNAENIEKRHFGLHIRMKDLTKNKLVSMVTAIISDQSYSKSIKKASRIFRDQQMDPKQTAAYWIDHVMKYGGDHLRSQTSEMSWFRIMMLDVLLVVFVALLVVSFTLFCICRFVFARFCCPKHANDSKSDIRQSHLKTN